ncbi:MAG: hypothetical protein QME25_02025 [Bacteroidota bacterium]|nr:hypothetical protein [Bacteroidota bacterium]
MKSLLSVFFVLILTSTLALSQEFGKEGVIEFGGNASFQSTTPVAEGKTGDATTTIMLSPTVGYFVIDGVEVGVDPLSYTSVSYPKPIDKTYSTLGFWAFGAYHFMTMGTTYPYVQALVGYTSASNGKSASGLAYGAAIGAKFEVASGLLINASAQYRFYTYTPEDADKRWGDNVLSIGIGISGFLK